MELVCVEQSLEMSTALTQRDIAVTGQLRVCQSGTKVSGTCSHQPLQHKSSNLKVLLKSETMKETRIETLVILQQPLLAVSCSQLPIQRISIRDEFITVTASGSLCPCCQLCNGEEKLC